MHRHGSRWIYRLIPLFVLTLWSSVWAAEPDWKARVLPAFCRDYTTVVAQAARARQAGLSHEEVIQMVLNGHVRMSHTSVGTIRTHLAAINAVFRELRQTPAYWEAKAKRVCLASGLNEEKLLH